MTVGEAFETFKEDNLDCQTGNSSFASLSPKAVGLVSDIPHNVCGCKIHQNMILIFSSLNNRENPEKKSILALFANGIMAVQRIPKSLMTRYLAPHVKGIYI